MDRADTFGIYVVAVFAAGNFGLSLWSAKDTREYRGQLAAEQHRRDDEARREAVERAPKAVNVRNNCYANGFSYTCTFTNMSEVTSASVCTHGKLAQKENPGVTLLSLTLCSGTLVSKETRQVTSPWLGGQPEAVCNRANGYGGTALDWSKCAFDVVED